MIRLAVVDDHPAVRQALIAAIGEDRDVEVIAQFGNGEQLLRAVREAAPDVVILERRLPGMDGNRLCQLLRQRDPRVRTVMASSTPDEVNVLEAFAAGARGFVMKDSEPATIRHAVRSAGSGGTFLDPRIADGIVRLALSGQRAKGPFDLSLQELRVLARLAKGRTNQEIADDLGIVESTVKTHVGNVLTKLGADDRSEAAAIALRHGLA